MAETTTANYGWTMPDPGASANTWGATLNATTQKVDAQVFANQGLATANQAPIGSITMFGSNTPPAGWLVCDGSSLLQTGAYAALFAIIGTTFGSVDSTHFTLPDLRGVFPSGASASSLIGAKGGASSTTLSAAQLPAHTHTIAQVAHTHTASQPAHVHPDPGHTHGASQAPHDHGGNIVGAQQPGGNLAGNPAGAQYPLSRTDVQQPGITIAAAGAGLQAAGADAVTVNPTTPTGPTVTGSIGSGATVPTVPPFLSIPFIIRYA